MKFTEEVTALFGQYEHNIRVIRDETTLEFFTFILRKVNNNQIRETTIKQMEIGKFYIIQYNFNGNKLWCPIFTIPPLPNKNEKGILERQLKIINDKNILYAINFDYLPMKYKALLIENIIKTNFDRYEMNSNKIFKGDRVKEEFNFKTPWIYTFLKRHDKNYSITAYDVLKILKVFDVSSTILHRFVFFDTYYVNRRIMHDKLTNIENDQLKEEFSDKLKTYDEILKIYDTDVEKFYKSLRSFEKNLKLMDEM